MGWAIGGVVLLVVGLWIARVGAVAKVLATLTLGAWVVADLVDFDVVLMPSIVLALATIVLLWWAEPRSVAQGPLG